MILDGVLVGKWIGILGWRCNCIASFTGLSVKTWFFCCSFLLRFGRRRKFSNNPPGLLYPFIPLGLQCLVGFFWYAYVLLFCILALFDVKICEKSSLLSWFFAWVEKQWLGQEIFPNKSNNFPILAFAMLFKC